MKIKRCKNCGIVKLIEEFYKHGHTKKGTPSFNPRCIYCVKLINKNNRKKEIRNKKGEEFEYTSKEHQKELDIHRKYRDKNRDKINANAREFYTKQSKEYKKRKHKMAKVAERKNVLAKIMKKAEEKRL